MRLIFIGALTAIGLSVAAPSGAFAAAIAPVGTAAGASQALPVHITATTATTIIIATAGGVTAAGSAAGRSKRPIRFDPGCFSGAAAHSRI